MEIKYTTFVTTKADVEAMVRALDANASKPAHKVKHSETGYWLQATRGKMQGRDVFRAMAGSNKTYLVKHVVDLFT